MKLLKYLDNIKRKGTAFTLADIDNSILYQGTVNSFNYWIHRDDYYQSDIDYITFEDDTLFIVLK